MLVRYTNPLYVHIYVISDTHTASGSEGLNCSSKDILQFTVKIRIYGCYSVRFYPLCFHPHLTHIVSYCLFSNIFPLFMQHLRDFGRTIVLMRFIINLSDCILDMITMFFSDRWDALFPCSVSRS